MKYTKQQRNQIYKLTLSHLTNRGEDAHMGICYSLKYALMEFNNSPETPFLANQAYYKHKTHFPELHKHKPRGMGREDGWFYYNKEGFNKRVSLLKDCIKQTAK